MFCKLISKYNKDLHCILNPNFFIILKKNDWDGLVIRILQLKKFNIVAAKHIRIDFLLKIKIIVF
jgi:hypothetical protein